jgi:hypothetical protein
MAAAVYLLCAITSSLCAGLLFRAYTRSRVSLLFWSGLCFTGLMVSNIMLFLDRIVFPETNLSLWRTIPTFAGVVVLLMSLIKESR